MESGVGSLLVGYRGIHFPTVVSKDMSRPTRLWGRLWSLQITSIPVTKWQHIWARDSGEIATSLLCIAVKFSILIAMSQEKHVLNWLLLLNMPSAEGQKDRKVFS